MKRRAPIDTINHPLIRLILLTTNWKLSGAQCKNHFLRPIEFPWKIGARRPKTSELFLNYFLIRKQQKNWKTSHCSTSARFSSFLHIVKEKFSCFLLNAEKNRWIAQDMANRKEKKSWLLIFYQLLPYHRRRSIRYCLVMSSAFHFTCARFPCLMMEARWCGLYEVEDDAVGRGTSACSRVVVNGSLDWLEVVLREY